MTHTKFRQFFLLLAFMLPVAWCGANSTNLMDGYSPIQIKEATVQGMPRGTTIHASICGHMLTVVFSENIGQVAVEVTTLSGAVVQCISTRTPDGLQMYVPNAGDYIITFTLANGDEYCGEFTVAD